MILCASDDILWYTYLTSVKLKYVQDGDADQMLCGVSTQVSAKIKYVTHWDLSTN